MPTIVVENARLVLPDRVIENGTLITSGGCVGAVQDTNALPLVPNAERVDATGLTLLPGFIDVHIHGGGGADTMDATPDAVRTICRTHARYGTTGLLLTTMTEGRERVTKALANAEQATEWGDGDMDSLDSDGAQVLGIHLEGPYISPKRPGAQAKEFVRPFDPDEWAEWRDATRRTLRLITFAPEEAGGDLLLAECLRNGIVASLGHTDASAAQTEAAVAQGVRHATHLFNAMPGIHHRAPGPIPYLLTHPEVFVEVIADGHHVAPEVIQLIITAKGIHRTILITDAMAGAGVGDGAYTLGGNPVTVAGGRATLADGTLAGSVLTMNQAVRNVRDWCGLDWLALARLSSANAAEQLHLPSKGRIAPGYDADFVLVDDDLKVHATFVAGRCVYRA